MNFSTGKISLLFLASLLGADPVAGLFDLSRLPVPLSDRMLLEVSSYDREQRNSGDGFFNAYYHYIEQGEYVVFDEYGPGVLVNLWLPADTAHQFTGDLHFFLDDDTLPALSLNPVQLFSGSHPLFPFPLTASDSQSSGGNYTFSPLAFKKHLKIRFTRTPGFYHFFFYRLKEGDSVQTMDPAGNHQSLAASIANPAPPLGTLSSGQRLLQPGELTTLFSVTGRGSVTRLKIRPILPSWEAADGLVLIAQWDGETAPQVFSPLASLFGAKNGLISFSSLPVTADSTGLELRFPMPYFQSARIYLRNDNPFPVTADFEIQNDLVPPPAGSLLFHAYHHHEIPAWSEYDYPLLTAEGRGHYAGAFLYGRTGRNRAFLEGDERCYVDGRSFPDLVGTGLEDYFLGGWYFRGGPFTLPFNGFVSTYKGAYERMTLYRFHIADRIPYLSHLKMGIERGGLGNLAEEMSSVAFFYHRDGSSLVETDSFSIGDTLAEKRHRYTHGKIVDEKWVGGVYLGDTNQYTVLYSRTIKDTVKFRIALRPDNRGALLRRVTDWAAGGQAADVYVDGKPAGPWGVPSANPFFRFYDADVWLPESLTAGKKTVEIKVRVRPDARAPGYSEIKYEVYAIAPDTAEDFSSSYVNEVERLPHPEGGFSHMFRWHPPLPPSRLNRILVYRDTFPGFTPSLGNLAGLTQDLTFTDSRLSLGQTYYYRFLSISPGGVKTWGRDTVRVRTQGSVFMQGEELYPERLPSPCSAYVFVTFDEDGDHPALPEKPEGADTLVSDGRYLQIPFQVKSDSAAFRFFLNAADTFYFSAGYITGKNRGLFELRVDGNPVGMWADAYSAKPGVGRVETKTPLALAAGEHRWTLASLGKHPLSLGFETGLDWIAYWTVGERYIYTPDSVKIQIARFAPNPFNPTLKIAFELSENSRVVAQMIDVNGRVVRTLLDGTLLRRRHLLVWDGKNDRGMPAASGVYIVRLRAGGRTASARAVLVR